MMAAVKDALKAEEILAARDVSDYLTQANAALVEVNTDIDNASTQEEIDALNVKKAHINNRITSLTTNLTAVSGSIATDANGYGYTQADKDEYASLILGG
jgi:hypothetical protein